MQILINIKNLFISPRFISFYWRTGAIALSGLIALVAENIADIGLPSLAVLIIGLVLGEASKALNNFINGKPMGFAPKN